MAAAAACLWLGVEAAEAESGGLVVIEKLTCVFLFSFNGSRPRETKTCLL